MAIIVEDGTLVDGANSYISEQDVLDYMQAREIEPPVGNIAPKIILAMDYLAALDGQWPGTQMGILAWPREDTQYTGIPANLKKAQIILTVKALSGISLFNDTTPDSQVLKREKIDVLEFEYAVPDTDAFVVRQPIFPEVQGLLDSLLTDNGWYGRTQVRRA